MTKKLNNRNWLNWLKCAGIRALKTFAQSLIAVFAVGSTVLDVNWETALATAGTAALLSVLTSVAGLPEEHYETDA